MSVFTDCLNNIKIIKLYSWIDIFKEKIDEKRNVELSGSLRRKIVGAITMCSFTFFPLLIQWASFAVYIGSGQTIDLSTAYAVISVFNMLSGPARVLSMFTGQFIELLIAVKRIQAFLLSDEINDSLVSKNAGTNLESS